MHNTAILILGSPRSGTSATAGVLRCLGVDLGAHLLPGTAENPKGYFEHLEIMPLNDEFLNAIGCSWDNPRSLPDALARDQWKKSYYARLRNIIYRDFQRSALWGIKDPRLCRLLPLWLPLLDELAVDVRILHVVRHPSEVVASLPGLKPMGPERGALLWLRYNLEAELATRTLPRTTLIYSRLLANWKQEMVRIGRELRVAWPIDPRTAATEIEEFLDSNLRHHQAGTAVEIIPPSYRNWLARADKSMSSLGTSGAADLDSLRAEVRTFEDRAVAIAEAAGLAKEILERQLASALEQSLKNQLAKEVLERQLASALEQSLQNQLAKEALERQLASTLEQSLQNQLSKEAFERQLASTLEQSLKIEQAHAHVEARSDQLTNELQSMLKSRSWRFTRPLRAIFSSWRRIIGRLCNQKI